jgi:tight adherence protein C
MLILVYGLILAAALLIIAGLGGIASRDSSQVKLPEAEAYGPKPQEKRSFLFFILPFSAPLLKKINLGQRIKEALDKAHVRMGAEEFFNLKVMLIAVLAAVAYFLIGMRDWRVLLAVAAGYFLPDLWLRRRVRQRRQAIVRSLPEIVDLLGLCVEAGLDFTTSVKWIIDKVPINPLLEEFAFVLEEIKWGKSRSQALKEMSLRLNIPEISSFVQTLVQADRMGTPVSEAFSMLSEDSRLQRFHRGERFALRAPIKILIPLVFCILPVIGIIIGGPILLQFMQGNLLKGF